jgi:hypothetical protein
MTGEPVDPGADGARAHDQGGGGAAAPAEAVAEAVGHLQTAALSMVAAVRAALDAAEQLAKDPSPLLALLSEATRQSTGGERAGPDAASAHRPRLEHIAVTPKPGSDPDDRSGGGVSRTSAEEDDEPSAPRDLG